MSSPRLVFLFPFNYTLLYILCKCHSIMPAFWLTHKIKRTLIWQEIYFEWQTSCLFSSTPDCNGPKYPPSYHVSFFSPPQVVWSWTASLFHHLHHPSKLIPHPALTAMFSSGQVVRRVVWCGGTDGSGSPVKDRLGGSGVFRCRQNEETEEGGLLALGCRSGRLSTDQTVTGCCLCACCCFCSFSRTLWMDGLKKNRAGSRRVPQVGQGYPSSLWEKPYYKIKI